MEGDVRELAERYAAAMNDALQTVQAGFSCRPFDDVHQALVSRLRSAGVPFDAAEVHDFAQQISDGADVLDGQA